MTKATQTIPRSTEAVWTWLEGVPDPEIPVVSVVDLGIVRAVEWRGDTLVVSITPTYSGCPATSVIGLDIEAALISKGVQSVEINVVRAPAWTTDWITEDAKAKLEAYGIAPPGHGATCSGLLAAGPIACPQCRSVQTEVVSQFGSTPCKASYRCRCCLEPFDYFKPF